MVGRILIVDDEKYVRWALKEHLRGCGFFIAEASDLQTALDLLSGHIFDGLLLSVELLENNGNFLIEKINKYEKKPCIFLVSKDDSIKYKNLAVDLGVYGVIKKPFRISEINKLLDKALK